MPKSGEPRASVHVDSGSGVRIEQMLPRHLDEVLVIEHSFAAPWSREMFLQELAKQWEEADALVLVERERVIGYVLFWFVADEVHIVNLAVHPRQRRRGMASRLLAEVFERAGRRGMVIATLEVRVHNTAAIRLYEKFGFEAVALRKGYYADNGEDALVMIKRLQPFHPLQESAPGPPASQPPVRSS